MRPESITVLDIGSSKIVAAAFRPNEDGDLEMLAGATSESKGVRRGIIVESSTAANAIDAVLKRVHQSAGIEIAEVVLGIGGEMVHSISSPGYLPIFPRGRTITREDVLQVINHSRHIAPESDYEQVQALPQEFVIDGVPGIRAPVGLTGGKLEVRTHVISADTRYLQALEKTVAMAGKRVDQMISRALASALAVLRPDEAKEGVALADIGGGTTEVAVFKNGSIAHTGSVPVGGQLVTSDLSKLLKTSIEEAERLKVSHGVALARLARQEEAVDVLQLGHTHHRPLQHTVLCEIIESRMRELALMVRDQIGKSGLYGELPAGIVITGGGSELRGTVDLFSDLLPDHPVRQGAPDVVGKSDFGGKPAMSTLVGLAHFVSRSYDDELSPAGGAGDWRERIRTFWSLVSGRA